MSQFILETIIWRTHFKPKTIVRCDKEVDHRSKRNSRYIDHRLTSTFLTKKNFVNWQSSSVIHSKNLCILRFSIVYGQDESKSQKRVEGKNRTVCEFIPMSRTGEDMMINFSESGHPVFRGSSSSKRGSLRSKGSGTFSINSVVIQMQLKWFFARLFPSINSVSTER